VFNPFTIKLTFKLSPELECKSEVVNTHFPAMHCKIGYVDFRTMTLAKAKELEKAGTDYLKRVPVKKTKSVV
jgi:hypothetical protein